jgi:hypothetical protein
MSKYGIPSEDNVILFQENRFRLLVFVLKLKKSRSLITIQEIFVHYLKQLVLYQKIMCILISNRQLIPI